MSEPHDDSLYLVRGAVFALADILNNLKQAAEAKSRPEIIAGIVAYFAWSEFQRAPHATAFRRMIEEMQIARAAPVNLQWNGPAASMARSLSTATEAIAVLAGDACGPAGPIRDLYRIARDQCTSPPASRTTSLEWFVRETMKTKPPQRRPKVPSASQILWMVPEFKKAADGVDTAAIGGWIGESLADFDYDKFALEAEYEFNQVVSRRQILNAITAGHENQTKTKSVPQSRLQIDQGSNTITLDGKVYPSIDPNAVAVMEAFLQFKEDGEGYVPFSKLRKRLSMCNDKTLCRWLGMLPTELRSLIKGKTGAGRWLELPAKPA